MHVYGNTLDIMLRLGQIKFNTKCTGKALNVSLGARMYRQEWCGEVRSESGDIYDKCRGLLDQVRKSGAGNMRHETHANGDDSIHFFGSVLEYSFIRARMPHIVYKDSQPSTLEHFGEGRVKVLHPDRRGIQMRRVVDEHRGSAVRMAGFEFSPDRLQFADISSMKDDIAPSRKELVGDPAPHIPR